jgi:hypothetical protein
MNNEYECSKFTSLSQENMICSASTPAIHIAIEFSMPWHSVPGQTANFPKPFLTLNNFLIKKKLEFGINYFSKNIFSIDNFTRIFLFKKNEDEFSDYQKYEFLFPNQNLEEAMFLLTSFITGENNKVLQWQIEDFKNTKELFVCVHGERDQCCGKYGLALFQDFEILINQLNYKNNFRVWQSSHLGGHRFAPTFFEAPSMRWYGLFEAKKIESFLDRSNNNFNVTNCYRGMSGIKNKYVQLAENFLFQKYSWEWLKYSDKKYNIISLDNEKNIIIEFSYKFFNSSETVISKFIIRHTGFIKAKASCHKNEFKDVSQYSVQQIDE